MPEPRDILANLISVHRSYMTDPEWLTHMELAELMIQALDIEGFVISRADAVRRAGE